MANKYPFSGSITFYPPNSGNDDEADPDAKNVELTSRTADEAIEQIRGISASIVAFDFEVHAADATDTCKLLETALETMSAVKPKEVER